MKRFVASVRSLGAGEWTQVTRLNARSRSYVRLQHGERTLKQVIEIRIARSLINIFEAVKYLRNHRSFVHGIDDMFDADETGYIFKRVVAILRSVETRRVEDAA